MQEIRYEFDKNGKPITKCKFFNDRLMPHICYGCECFNGGVGGENLVYCKFDESFLGRCLSALNWQRVTPEQILEVLRATREFMEAFKNYSDTWVSIDNDKQPIIPAFDNLTKSLQESTDAPSNS